MDKVRKSEMFLIILLVGLPEVLVSGDSLV